MRSLVINFTVLLFLISPLIAQVDSACNLNNVSCTITRTFLIKDINTDKTTSKTYLQDIESVKYLGFIKDDSIFIKSSIDSVYRLNINHLKEMSIFQGGYSTVGFVAGAAAGMFAGYLIGASAKFSIGSSGLSFSEGWTIPLGMLLGCGIGGFIGYIIGSEINKYETLELFNIHEKYKKDSIIKFIRQK